MSANDLLTLLTQVFFILLGIVTVVDYLRHRDSTRREIALMFSVLALPFLIQLYELITGPKIPWLDTIGTIALVSQPFLLLQLARYYRLIPSWLMKFAAVGMVLSWTALILLSLFPTAVATVILLAIIIYFVVVDGYAMISFVQGARTTSGVVRQRLRFAAAGSGLLALALLLIAVMALIPILAALAPLILVCGIAAALSYYLGFAPPRWLRRAWQLTELRNFLLDRSTKPIGQRLNVTEALSELCYGVNRAIGGSASAVAQEDGEQHRWVLRYVSDNPELINKTRSGEGILKQVWQGRTAQCFRASDGLSESDQQLLEMFGTSTVIVAPITTAHRSWGLLLVFMRHNPLFLEDDLEMTLILAQQSAIFLENNTLVEELNSYSEQLQQKVEQRTLELAETRNEYQRIVETAQEGIWQTDNNYNTTFVNARLCELLGYPPEEILSKPATAFIDPASIANVADYRIRRQQGIREQFELAFRRKDGSILIGLVSSTPLTDEHGNYAGALAMVADITERKQAEEQIRQLNTELEQRVVERTAQLSAVNRELEAFSYSVSHDLRTPLRALDGFSQILIEDYSDQLDDAALKYLQRIRAGSQRMGQLIDAMLQLSRLTRVDMQIAPVNLSQMAQSIKTDLQEQDPEREVDFRIQENLVAKGDERLLRVALTNLLNNAWKFTSNQAAPCVEFGVREENGQQVYFVRDNGVGFDMAYANKLFGAFQRLHGHDEFEGTGIGLATVERILTRHSGKIWAAAAIDQGATFYFTI